MTNGFPRNFAPVALAVAMAISNSGYAQEVELEEVLVSGTRATLANSVAMQRESDKVSSVIDSDGAGDFPDINVAESLRRLPGISLENDQGEGRYVTVRGLNTDLNAMTINGVSTASPENRRGIMLDGVPTDLLDSMTVYKTLTPDLDADTIGGAVNLDTVTAFKYEGSRVRLRAESSYNDQSDDANNPKFSLLATNRWRMDGGEFGAALTLSHQNRRIVSYNNEVGGFWNTEEGDGSALNSDYEMRFYDIERRRQGAALNLDYRADGGNNYYSRLFYNKYREHEYRAKWEVRRAIEADLEDISVNGDVFTYPFQRVDTEARPRIEYRSIASALIGAEFALSDNLQLTAELFGSKADQEDKDKWNAIFRSPEFDDVTLTYDNSNPRKPVLNFDPRFYDASNFELNAMETEFAVTKDKDFGGKLDFSQAFNDSTRRSYGIKFRSRSKDNNFDFCGYEPEDDSTLADYDNRTIGAYFGNVQGPSPTFHGTRGIGETIGVGFIDLIGGTRCPNPTAAWSFSGDEAGESVPGDWYSDEDVTSGYAMATSTFNDTTAVYGLRYEHTKARYEGKELDSDDGVSTVVFRDKYGFLAPSLNIKHVIGDDRQLRFGLFRSLVRPGFGETAAGASIDLEDNEISAGNPDLVPTKAWNADLGFEWYMGAETFFGAGIFYKRIEDAIARIEAENIVLRGQTWDAGTTYINIGNSNILGAELSYQTVFSNGLLMTFNYTLADGEVTLPAGAVGAEGSFDTARKIPFFKQAKHSANASVGYDKGPWDLRLSASYRDKYLDIIGGNALNDRYTTNHMQLDLKGRYDVNDNLAVSAGVININDRPEYYYFGNTRRLSQYDEFGRTWELGFTYTF
ncbi:MAG TPA: TonB-dependent receptor [Steroidobacteraceae bacterium]|nr:TonB-dependent receptor [Steroidobacteraceae bacterium]